MEKNPAIGAEIGLACSFYISKFSASLSLSLFLAFEIIERNQNEESFEEEEEDWEA